MADGFEVKLSDVGISQIYLNRHKINGVQRWFQPGNVKTGPPLPVRDFGNGRLTLTDGHSRAYVAYEGGMKDINVQIDNDAIVTCEFGQAQYKTCIEWCERFSLYGIADLGNRIVSDAEYQVVWIRRCHRMRNLITATSHNRLAITQDDISGFYLYGAEADMSVLYLEDEKGFLFQLKDGIITPEPVAEC